MSSGDDGQPAHERTSAAAESHFAGIIGMSKLVPFAI